VLDTQFLAFAEHVASCHSCTQDAAVLMAISRFGVLELLLV